MEVKEVFKIEDPVSGRVLHLHLSDKEHIDVMQAGLYFLMHQGYINFKGIQAEQIEVPEGSTTQ